MLRQMKSVFVVIVVVIAVVVVFSFEKVLKIWAKYSDNRKMNNIAQPAQPVNQSRSPIGRGENCEAYRKSLHDLQPLIFGCTTSIKPQKPGKPTCDARTSVSRLTPIFGLFQVVKRFCIECDRGFTESKILDSTSMMNYTPLS